MTDGPEFPSPSTVPADAGVNGVAEVESRGVNGTAETEPHGVAGGADVESHAVTNTAELTEAGGRFHIDLPAYRGPLDALVGLAQRGEIDLADVQVSEITASYRRWLEASDPKPEAREVADFLTLAGRLVTLKAQRLLPDGPLEVDQPVEEELAAGDDPGARLAEYRLFKEAAEALLSEVAEQGARSFLSLVAPDVIPVERLAIPAERLAAAFRAVLERIPDVDPLHLQASLFSVEEKLAGLRDMLRNRRTIAFDELFLDVRSRLEAVATFLALLELLKAGAARVTQSEAFGDIMVTLVD